MTGIEVTIAYHLLLIDFRKQRALPFPSRRNIKREAGENHPSSDITQYHWDAIPCPPFQNGNICS